MLLSFRNRLTITLCPTHIAVGETGRGWRKQCSQPVAFAAESVDVAPGWKVPLAALALWLEKSKPAAADVEVILSDCFVRYALVPWSDDVQAPSEMAMFSRIHFESLYGTAAMDWDIQADAADYGKPGIGCAVDMALVEALRGLLAQYGLRLTLLQPYFMHAFNRYRDRINGNALFAVLDSGLCVMATFKDGAWKSIRTVRAGDDAETGLPKLIERELLLQGLDALATVYLHLLTPLDTTELKRNMKVVLLDVPTLMLNSTAKQAAGQIMLLCRDG